VPELVSIIIPAFNQLDYCRQCVHSLLANTRPPYQLILVDNGSTDGVGEFFDSIPGVDVVHAGQNRGFAGGVNLGLARAEGHALLLNSDTIVPRGWLERLETALLRSDDIGVVGPMSNCVSGSQQIDGLEFTSMDQINEYAQCLGERNHGKLRDVARLVGFCVLIRDRVVREVGLFDESYGIGNYEDDDYCVRVLRAGYRLCVAEDAFVFHYGGRTFLGMGLVDDEWRALMQRNEQVFAQKWNASPVERSDAAQASRQLNRQARTAFEKGDLVEAARLLREAIRTFPLLEVNYNDLGVICWQSGDSERALSLFRQAARINPSFEDARRNVHDAAQALGCEEGIEPLMPEPPNKEG